MRRRSRSPATRPTRRRRRSSPTTTGSPKTTSRRAGRSRQQDRAARHRAAASGGSSGGGSAAVRARGPSVPTAATARPTTSASTAGISTAARASPSGTSTSARATASCSGLRRRHLPHYAGDNIAVANADKTYVRINSLTDIQEIVTASKDLSVSFQTTIPWCSDRPGRRHARHRAAGLCRRLQVDLRRRAVLTGGCPGSCSGALESLTGLQRR